MKLSIVILTVALATVCSGGSSTELANEYLKSNWKAWFKILDVNHDGIISKADKEKTRVTFPKLHHFDADQTKKVRAQFGKWWTEFIFETDTHMTVLQFVEGLNAKFSSNQQKFHDQIDKCVTMAFKDIFDTNKDESISEQEFIFGYQTYGQENVASVKQVFQSYKRDPIPLSIMIESWVNFLTVDEESKVTIKTGLENVE